MNKAIQMLFEEHSKIVNAIDSINRIKPMIQSNPNQFYELTTELLHFFRKYADGYHHHKEEIILFPLMNKKNELLAEGVVAEMFSQHEEFREIISNIEKSLNEQNFEISHKLLVEYTDALLDHIAVENEEVFMIAESLLTDAELEKMYFDFQDTDRQLGTGLKAEWEEWVESLRGKLHMAE